jgi:hypothetical protein
MEEKGEKVIPMKERKRCSSGSSRAVFFLLFFFFKKKKKKKPHFCFLVLLENGKHVQD